MTKGFYGAFGKGAFTTDADELEEFRKFNSYQTLEKIDDYVEPPKDL